MSENGTITLSMMDPEDGGCCQRLMLPHDVTWSCPSCGAETTSNLADPYHDHAWRSVIDGDIKRLRLRCARCEAITHLWLEVEMAVKLSVVKTMPTLTVVEAELP